MKYAHGGLEKRKQVNKSRDKDNSLKNWQTIAAEFDQFFLRDCDVEFRQNRELVRQSISYYGNALEYVPEYRDDYDIVKSAVSSNPSALTYASDRLKDNFEIVLSAVSSQKNKNIYWELDLPYARSHGGLAEASFRLRSNREIVRKSVEISGTTLKFASTELRNDKDIVLSAIKQNGYAVRFASDDLRKNQEIIDAVIESNPAAIVYIDQNLLTLDMILKAVETGDFSIKTLENKWLSNKEIIEKAVSKDGKNIQFASNDLKNNFELATIAIKNSPDSIEFLSPTLKRNRILIKLAVEHGYTLPEKYFKDHELVLINLQNIKSIQNNDRKIEQLVGEWYKGDWVQKIIRNHLNSLEVAKLALQCRGLKPSIQYFLQFSDEIQNNFEVCALVASSYGDLPYQVQSNRDFAINFLPSYFSYEDYPENLKADTDFLNIKLKESPRLVRDLPKHYSALKNYRIAKILQSYDGSDLSDEDVKLIVNDDDLKSNIVTINPILFFKRDGLQEDRKLLILASEKMSAHEEIQILESLFVDNDLMNLIKFIPKNIPDKFIDDKNYILQKVENGYPYYKLSKNWQLDIDIVKACLTFNHDNGSGLWSRLVKKLKLNREIIKSAIKSQAIYSIKDIPEIYQKDDLILEEFYQYVKNRESNRYSTDELAEE